MAIKREVIGWDIEEMPITANNEVTSSKNVLGSNSVLLTTGVATTDLDPIKFNSAHNFAKFLQLASTLQLQTDKVKRKFTAIFENLKYGDSEATAKTFAYRETADVDVSALATGNEALQGTATLHWNGKREFCTYEATGDTATVTPIPNFDETDFSKFHFADGISKRETFALFFEYDEDEFN